MAASYGRRSQPQGMPPTAPAGGWVASTAPRGVVGALQSAVAGVATRLQRGGPATPGRPSAATGGATRAPVAALGAQARGGRALTRLQRPGSRAKLGAPGLDEMRGTLRFRRG